MQLLIEHGTDYQTKNGKGKRPLALARDYEREDAAVYRRAIVGDKSAWTTAFRNEIELLKRLKHLNLIELLGWGIESAEGRLAVVLERTYHCLP